jgi:glutaredoxin
MESCPYCKEALRFMDELFAKNPEYRGLKIEKIDELIHPDIAAKYDYYYVPTYFVGDEKLHEGAASLMKVKRVFDAAMEG